MIENASGAKCAGIFRPNFLRRSRLCPSLRWLFQSLCMKGFVRCSRVTFYVGVEHFTAMYLPRNTRYACSGRKLLRNMHLVRHTLLCLSLQLFFVIFCYCCSDFVFTSHAVVTELILWDSFQQVLVNLFQNSSILPNAFICFIARTICISLHIWC